jgi:predicted cupin superfamily sugar epimerase
MVSPLVEALGLEPHPEGGWFRETWRSSVELDRADGARRSSATLIHFLLHAGESSTWHRVRADEIWLAHLGVVTLQLGGSGVDPVAGTRAVMGTDVTAGQRPQVVVPAGHWQRTLPGSDDALVSCMVSPGFDFADFEMHRSS